jgi:hypothetical protein
MHHRARREIDDMIVRGFPGMASVRYRARRQLPSGHLIRCWHTDCCEKQATMRQMAWPQATCLSLAASL